MKATLILQNGAIFEGTSIGSTETGVFELVFNTGMTGYQELLTDPSYAGQGVVLSYPLIGNYGVNGADNESRQPWVKALVVRHLAERGSNFRCEGTLDDYLKQHNIPGIQGVDTRAITRILRNQGTMNGMVTCAERFCVEEALAKLNAYAVTHVTAAVTRGSAEILPPTGTGKCGRVYRIALLDYGVKNSVLECLRSRGCEITVYPASVSAEEILSGGFDGVVLSNGPGDPALCTQQIGAVKELYESGTPLFAIALGHQLLALATGARTRKLPYGHRGGNHPVRDLATGKVYITAQNHGYAVCADSVDPAVAAVSHVNVNDGTVEGLDYSNGKAFGVQFNPETNDVKYLVDRFIDRMGGGCNA